MKCLCNTFHSRQYGCELDRPGRLHLPVKLGTHRKETHKALADGWPELLHYAALRQRERDGRRNPLIPRPKVPNNRERREELLEEQKDTLLATYER